MVICPDCGKDVTDAKFCSNCGASLKPPVEEVVETVEENAPVEETIDAMYDENIENDEAADEISEDVIDDEIEEETAADEISEDVIDDEIEETASDETEEIPVQKSKFCTNCGRELEPETVFCPQCGYKFGADEEKPQTKFCQNCGKKIDINAEICPHCGVRVASPNFAAYGEKSVALSAILSFLFPGLGHLYIGLNKKGVSFILAYIVSAILIFLFVGFILMIIIWIWALIDSIQSTEAINRGEFVEDKLF